MRLIMAVLLIVSFAYALNCYVEDKTLCNQIESKIPNAGAVYKSKVGSLFLVAVEYNGENLPVYVDRKLNVVVAREILSPSGENITLEDYKSINIAVKPEDFPQPDLIIGSGDKKAYLIIDPLSEESAGFLSRLKPFLSGYRIYVYLYPHTGESKEITLSLLCQSDREKAFWQVIGISAQPVEDRIMSLKQITACDEEKKRKLLPEFEAKLKQIENLLKNFFRGKTLSQIDLTQKPAVLVIWENPPRVKY